MGTTISVVKTLIVPALISLIIYLVSSYILYPLWQRYRTRYSAHYLPITDSLSSHTSSVRARITAAAGRYLVPSSWRRRQTIVTAEEDSDDDSEDGEELEDVRGMAGITRGGDDVRRLSRDLEEGFMDDSDEEVDGERDRRL